MLKVLVCLVVFGFGLSAGVVMAQWDGLPVAPLPANMHSEYANFDIQIHSRDAATWGDNNLESMMAQHGPDCSGPPNTHENHSYTSSVFVCNDHVMTSINASGYGLVILTPSQLLNCATGCSVQWEMSTERLSTRDWPDVWITPWADNLTLPFDDGEVDLQGNPRSGVHIDGNNAQNSWLVSTLSNYIETDIPGCWWCSWQDGIATTTNQAAIRQTFKLTITPGRIRMERLASTTAPQLTFVDAPAPVLLASDYVVQFGHHSYNPTKDGSGTPGTWHWDNFTLSPSTPFTIIHTPTRAVMGTATGTTGAVSFNAPAPANSWLRFTAIGTVQYSLNGGATWLPASKQAFISHYEHQSPYFIPIPAGTITVQVRMSTDSWYQGPFIAKDFAIWSKASSSTGPSVSLFAATDVPAIPAVPDATSYEVGMRFTASQAGSVTGMKFYKGVGNGGTHIGRLWSTSGALLSSVTFSGESASGWQTATFPSPVSVSAGQTYVISYGAPQGRISVTAGGFNATISKPPLTAPAGPPNGVYNLGAGSFPAFAAPGNNNYFVDVLFSATAPPPPTCPCSLFAATDVPAVPAVADGNAYEVGMRFTSSQAGFVTGVKFYKGAGNGGTHVGRLWSSSGALLSSVTFSGESASGWQTATFPSAVSVGAGQTYVISYSAPQGRISVTAGGFNAAISKSPLTAPAGPPNGVYSSAGSFPAFAAPGNNNYFVDVVFNTTPPPPPTCPCTLFASTDVPAVPAVADGNAYEVGMRFTTSQAGFVTGVKFYKGVGNGGTHVGRLWSTSGALLSSVTFSGESASGWQTATFPSPVSVSAGQTYVISYSAPQGRISVTAGGFNAAISKSPLTAPAGPPNGVYSSAGSFPAFAAPGNNNYFVDVVFQ